MDNTLIPTWQTRRFYKEQQMKNKRAFILVFIGFLIVAICASILNLGVVRRTLAGITGNDRLSIDLRSISAADQAWLLPFVSGIAESHLLRLRAEADDPRAERADLALFWVSGDVQSAAEAGQLPFLADPYGLYIATSEQHNNLIGNWEAFIDPRARIRDTAAYTVAVAGDDDETLLAFAIAAVEAAHGPADGTALLAEIIQKRSLGPDGRIDPASRWGYAATLLRGLTRDGVLAADWTNWDQPSALRSLRDGLTACAFARFSDRASYSALERGTLRFLSLPGRSGRSDHSVTARVLVARAAPSGRKTEAAANLASVLAAGDMNPAPLSWQNPYWDFGRTTGNRIERSYKSRLALAAAVLALAPVAPGSYPGSVAEALRLEVKTEDTE